METGAQTGGLMPAGVVWNAAADRSDRSGLSMANLTGVLGRAIAVSAATHAILIGVLGAAVLEAPTRNTASPPPHRLLHASLRPEPAAVTAPPAATQAPPPVLLHDAPGLPVPAPRPGATGAGAPQAPNLAAAPTAPLIVVGVPDLARYYLPREVDQPPAPLLHAPMLYPEDALKRRIGGVVVMHVYIGADGTIDQTEVVRAEPPGVFEQAVRDALLASRFRPALLGRTPVNSRITIEVPFDPECSDFMTCTARHAAPGQR